MNNDDIELGLQGLLRGAPTVSAPENLRQAVAHDRADERTTGRFSVDVRPWIRRRPARVAGAILGLAATLVLTAGLISVVLTPQAQPAASSVLQPVTVAWRGVGLPEPVLLRLGSFVELNGKLVAGLWPQVRYAADSNTGDGVWSYEEATSTWVQLAGPNALVSGEPTAQAHVIGVAVDGGGGLFAYGHISRWDAAGYESQEATIWHSAGGNSWEASDLGPGSIDALFLRPNTTVAVGETGAKPQDCSGEAAAASWTSTDSRTWTKHAFDADPYVVASAVDVGSRILIRDFSGCPSKGQDDHLWTSTDGSLWQRISASGFPSGGYYDLVPLTQTRVILAYDRNDTAKPPLISSDGAAWHSAAMPSSSDGQSLLGIGQAGGTLLAFGSAGAVWCSSDGEHWQVLDESSWFSSRGRPYVGPQPDSLSGAAPAPSWSVPIVEGDQVAIPDVTLADGTYGILLGNVIVRNPTASTPSN